MHVEPPQLPPPQSVALVHGAHFAGSWIVVASHIGEVAGLIAMSTQPAASHSVQQPKQSQPGGVIAPHTSLHCCGTCAWPSGAKHSATLYLEPSCCGLLTMPISFVAHSSGVVAP